MGHPGGFEIISGFASTFDCVDASIFLHALQARDAKLHFNGSQLFFCYIIPFPIPNADRLTIFYNKVVAGESHAGLESLSFFLLLVCQIWWVGRVWTVCVELKQMQPSV